MCDRSRAGLKAHVVAIWLPRRSKLLYVFVFFSALPCPVLSNGYGSNSPLTPSARISALNIVSDLLRKVGVSQSISFPVFLFKHQVSGLLFSSITSEVLCRKSQSFHSEVETSSSSVYVSPQALESKLAACRNFAKDQKARKAYALDNSNVLNANTTNYSQSLHTSYFDKA